MFIPRKKLENSQIIVDFQPHLYSICHIYIDLYIDKFEEKNIRYIMAQLSYIALKIDLHKISTFIK